MCIETLEETHMAQARTLDDAQIKRVQRYLRTRRNSTRDSTIFTFAFNTGLSAKELAALCVGDAYDAQGAVRDAFVLQRSQTKGARTRTVYVNRTLRVSLEQYRPTLYSVEPTAPLCEPSVTSASVSIPVKGADMLYFRKRCS